MPNGEIAIDDPHADDVRDLLERHVTWAHGQTVPEDAHALDAEGLSDPGVTFSLETGAMEAFSAARALYERGGFELCEPFGDYRASRNSTYMTLRFER